MKLGELKSSLRTRKGNPSVMANLKDGCDLVPVVVQKASILSALDAMFTGGKSEETGLVLSDDGFLVPDSAVVKPRAASPASVSSVSDEIDDLDLDGGIGEIELDEIDEL